MKKLLFLFTLVFFLVTPLHVSAGNDCTEWLGTWQVERITKYYDGSTGITNQHWEIDQADQYVAYGSYYNEPYPQYIRTIEIRWSSAKGLYLFESDDYGDREIELTILGDTFTGYYKYPYPDNTFFDSYTFNGTRIGNKNAAGSLVIEDNLDLTVTDAGLGDLKLDFVLKCYIDPTNPSNVIWYLDPQSIKIK